MRFRPPHGRSWALPIERGPDFRQRGTLSYFLFEALAAAEDGYSRDELREIVAAEPSFADRLSRRRSALGEALGRLRRGGRIRLDDGRYRIARLASRRPGQVPGETE